MGTYRLISPLTFIKLTQVLFPNIVITGLILSRRLYLCWLPTGIFFSYVIHLNCQDDVTLVYRTSLVVSCLLPTLLAWHVYLPSRSSPMVTPCRPWYTCLGRQSLWNNNTVTEESSGVADFSGGEPTCELLVVFRSPAVMYNPIYGRFEVTTEIYMVYIIDKGVELMFELACFRR